MEIIELLSVHHTAQDVLPVEVLARAQAHSKNIGLGHLVNQLLRDERAVILLLPRLRGDVLVGELAHRLLKSSVAVIVVRAGRFRLQPQRFGVRDLAQIARLRVGDLGFLALDFTEAEGRVLLQYLMSVEIVEGLGRICASYLGEDDGAARVGVDEVGQIVYFVIDDCPDILLGVVLSRCQLIRMLLDWIVESGKP